MTAPIDNFNSAAGKIGGAKKIAAIPVISKNAATILEVGEIHSAGKRTPYRPVTVLLDGDEEPQPMILPTYIDGDHVDDRLLVALPALHAAGVSNLTLTVANAETWKHPRILGVALLAPGHREEAGSITSTSPTPEPSPAPVEEASVPAPNPTVADLGQKLQAKRYNTSDGFDRQMIKIPGTGPLSKLFEGTGFYKWHKFGDMYLVQPVANPVTDEAKRHVFKSSAPQKNGDREVFFHCMVRASKHAKANAPISYFLATPHQGGMQLHRVK